MSTETEQWQDILITDRDITLDAAGLPEMVTERPTISQDIVHMIMESGLLIDLVGERSMSRWTDNMNQVEVLIEDDTRIIPGTVQIDWSNPEKIHLYAKSVLGDIKVGMPV